VQVFAAWLSYLLIEEWREVCVEQGPESW